jgi:hypothetical protein
MTVYNRRARRNTCHSVNFSWTYHVGSEQGWKPVLWVERPKTNHFNHSTLLLHVSGSVFMAYPILSVCYIYLQTGFKDVENIRK